MHHARAVPLQLATIAEWIADYREGVQLLTTDLSGCTRMQQLSKDLHATLSHSN
jgi:hypothetical protein